ncbi:MAG TPA: metalloregulator ArsR/SmtB family transcription factor [Methylomirabilota bacterium]
MATTHQIAEVASHLGEPARVAMLAALMDGRALTATELAGVAGITPQTASSHLSRLTRAGLLRVDRQGRHRYHRLAAPEVARMLEGVMQLASRPEWRRRRPLVVGPRDAALRMARTCYDHLAGQLGVAIADALVTRGVIELDDDGGVVTALGVEFFRGMGLALAASSTRPLVRPCLDWSERRLHIAGKVGAAICRHAVDRRWVRRLTDSRALEITAAGRDALRELFAIGALRQYHADG